MPSTGNDEPRLPRESLRAMYRRGLELANGARLAFTIITTGGRSVTIVLSNASEGLVNVSCADERACAELRRFIGFRVEERRPEVKRTDGVHDLRVRESLTTRRAVLRRA